MPTTRQSSRKRRVFDRTTLEADYSHVVHLIDYNDKGYKALLENQLPCNLIPSIWKSKSTNEDEEVNDDSDAKYSKVFITSKDYLDLLSDIADKNDTSSLVSPPPAPVRNDIQFPSLRTHVNESSTNHSLPSSSLLCSPCSNSLPSFHKNDSSYSASQPSHKCSRSNLVDDSTRKKKVVCAYHFLKKQKAPIPPTKC